MDLPNLETWQDFFNFEAERIVDLTEEQIEERIRDYSRILQAVQAMSWANIKRLENIVSEEKKRILPTHLANLKTVLPRDTKEKAERVSKNEQAIRSLMKTLKCDRAAAEEMVNQMKAKEWEKVRERGAIIPESE